ncbi:unnamed protein product [Lampetra fluviatilis]
MHVNKRSRCHHETYSGRRVFDSGGMKDVGNRGNRMREEEEDEEEEDDDDDKEGEAVSASPGEPCGTTADPPRQL